MRHSNDTAKINVRVGNKVKLIYSFAHVLVEVVVMRKQCKHWSCLTNRVFS